MRRIIIVLFSMLLVSCQFAYDVAGYLDKNPFTDEVDITKGYSDSSYYRPGEYLRFVMISDVHIGREGHDSGVVEKTDEFLSFLEGKNYPFLICLGDLTDDGHYEDAAVGDFMNACLPHVNSNFIYVLGNHDKHVHTQDSWVSFIKKLRTDESRILRYRFGEVSLYKLDNSSRIYGREQLEYLREALSEDDNPFRIALAHENTTTGGVFDQSLFLFGTADIAERNRLYSIMDKGDAGILLTGHHHKGNIAYHVTDTLGEFNAAALHARETAIPGLESKGFWYECVLDMERSTLSIKAYLADSGAPTGEEWVFSLPRRE